MLIAVREATKCIATHHDMLGWRIFAGRALRLAARRNFIDVFIHKWPISAARTVATTIGVFEILCRRKFLVLVSGSILHIDWSLFANLQDLRKRPIAKKASPGSVAVAISEAGKARATNRDRLTGAKLSLR